ncbi:helix-turn-helix transcriptional regulator [Fulvivirga sp.]|uniref:helix-turn-helix domain-containing protein n=1 Tax=Fulvivirga sp. TaxID=1931237 RepID=UPI0032F08249
MHFNNVQKIKVHHLEDEDINKRFFRMERLVDHYDRVGGQTSKPHRHDFYTIIWLQDGKGFHIIDFNKFKFAPNQVYFISPGQIHQISHNSRPKGWSFSFTNDFLIKNNISNSFLNNINMFRQYGESPPLVVNNVVKSELELIVDQMMPFYEGTDEHRLEGLGALLLLFLIHCNKACDLPYNVGSAASCLLIDFRTKVEDQFRDLHKVNQYADQMSISAKHLNEVVKDTIGQTAKDYIVDRIILEAKRMLTHTHMTAKQIALELGFKEALHFSTFFKKVTGETPIQFRNNQKVSV